MYTGIVNAYGSGEIIRKNLPWIIDLFHSERNAVSRFEISDIPGDFSSILTCRAHLPKTHGYVHDVHLTP